MLSTLTMIPMIFSASFTLQCSLFITLSLENINRRGIAVESDSITCEQFILLSAVAHGILNKYTFKRLFTSAMNIFDIMADVLYRHEGCHFENNYTM